MAGRNLLDIDAIIESAHIAVCANDLVDDGLRARLAMLLDGIRQSGPLDNSQQLAARRQIVKLLTRRLAIARDIRQFPEILDEVIDAPLFVIGFPRTGTTLLHCLLAADPAHRGVELWQVREPSPPPGQQPVARARYALAERDLLNFLERCPGQLLLHPYWDGGAPSLCEDDEIVSLDLRTTYPTMLYDLPSIGYMVSDGDHAGTYAFLKQYLQHQQWRRPRARWVLKGCEHQRHLGQLFAMFPDARCLFPHREPQQFVTSGAAVGASVFDPVTSGLSNRLALGQYTVADYARRFAEMAGEPLLGDPRVTHVPFTRIATDPVDTLRAAYGQWGYPWTPEAEAAIRGWLDDPANRGDRYGKPIYSDADYGIDWPAVSHQFDDYRQRFLSRDTLATA